MKKKGKRLDFSLFVPCCVFVSLVKSFSLCLFFCCVSNPNPTNTGQVYVHGPLPGGGGQPLSRGRGHVAAHRSGVPRLQSGTENLKPASILGTTWKYVCSCANLVAFRRRHPHQVTILAVAFDAIHLWLPSPPNHPFFHRFSRCRPPRVVLRFLKRLGLGFVVYNYATATEWLFVVLVASTSASVNPRPVRRRFQRT